MQFALQSSENFLTAQPIVLNMELADDVTVEYAIVRFRIKPNGAIVHMELDNDLDGIVSEQKDMKVMLGVTQRTGTAGQQVPVLIMGRTKLTVRGNLTDLTASAVETNSGICHLNLANKYSTLGAVPKEGEMQCAIGLGETEGEELVDSGNSGKIIWVLFDGIQKFGPKLAR
ncbi:MAG: hypothetical protein ACO3O3_07260 [Ilumatobacteraceae bacterium]